jgi:phosphate:Na+ symporter
MGEETSIGGILVGVLGGVGLFLLGMRLMTDGLRLAAGRALHRILESGTSTRMRGVLSGVLITSLVQSSSAVTVAVIGFANAGLLSLAQAVSVIFGSNVGTTVTAWLVALVGVHVNVKATALPLIGTGMALRLARNGRPAGALGEALAGFGLFFLGIDVLKQAMTGLSGRIPVEALNFDGPGGVAVLVMAGFALTLLMQSSSAAIAVILTTLAGGVLPIASGACLVVGANIGTTSTAALAVIGATANAKRVAMAHVAFNLITGAAALLSLPLLLLLLARGRAALGLDDAPAAVVAAFHTLFNLLGIAIMWPLSQRLVALLERRFRTPEEDERTPRFLDANVSTTPLLAARALGLELARLGRITRETAHSAITGSAAVEAIGRRRETIDDLVRTVGDFSIALQRQRLPAAMGHALPTAIRVARYYAEAGELAQLIRRADESLTPLPNDCAEMVRGFESRTLALLEATAVDLPETTKVTASAGLESVETVYAALKQQLLEAGAQGRIPVAILVAWLDRLSNVRRLAQQMEHAALHLLSLRAIAESVDPTDP